MTQISESDYKTAQEGDSQSRQKFIESMDLGELRKIVPIVLYFPMGLKQSPYTQMSCIPIDALGLNLDKSPTHKSLIGIYPSAFEMSLGIFRSVLIDHEGYHARQNHLYPQAVNKIEKLILSLPREKTRELKSVLEIPAYLYQINNMGKNNFDPDFTQVSYGLAREISTFLNAEKKYPGRLMPLLESVVDEKELAEINQIFDNYRKLA
jgi:hypothetical protein